jgi:hypothetical protein
MTRLSMKSEDITNPDGTIKEEGPTDKIAEIFGSKYNRYFIFRLLCCIFILYFYYINIRIHAFWTDAFVDGTYILCGELFS